MAKIKNLLSSIIQQGRFIGRLGNQGVQFCWITARKLTQWKPQLKLIGNQSVKFCWEKAKKIVQWISQLKLNRFRLILAFTIILPIFGIGIYLIPHNIPFEGNLVIEQLGFMTTQNQPFLDGVKIDEIKISGKQKYIFEGFEGEFESKEIQQLNKTSKLTVVLQDKESSLTIAPISEKGFLRISQLSLLANTEVTQLIYEPFSLHFSLLQPDIINSHSFEQLAINIGVPVKILLQGNFQISGIQNNQNQVQITAKAIGDFKTLLPKQADLQIKLHDSEQNIFFGNNLVKKVNFDRQELMLDYEDYGYSRSAILSGTLRMAGQTVTVEKDQFIKTGNKGNLQNIKNLPYIRIVHDESSILQMIDQKLTISKPLYGLEVGISGQTTLLQVGINPNLPIKTIRGTYISQLSSETVNVLLIVFTALFSGLLTGVISNIPENSQSPNPPNP